MKESVLRQEHEDNTQKDLHIPSGSAIQPVIASLPVGVHVHLEQHNTMIHENLYSATYSGVAVYEFIHPKSSVMRRKKDGWVNATHILKVANFPKAKRTRILEKDVQTGVHEKVQGGYGKYQGTWVPLKRAIEIAQQFGVLNDLNPVFDYVSNGSITPPPAPKHHHATTALGTRKPRNSNNASSSATAKTTRGKAKPKDKAKPKSASSASSSTVAAESKPAKRQKLSSTSAPGIKPALPSSASSQHERRRPSELTVLTSNNAHPSIDANQAANNMPLSGYHGANLTPTSASRNSLLLSNLNDLDRSKRILKAPRGMSNTQQPYQTIPMGSHFPSLDNDLDDDIDEDVDDEDEEDEDDGLLHNHNNIQGHTFKNPESPYHRLHEPSTVEFMSEHDLDKALAESETYGDMKKSISFFSTNNTNNSIPNSKDQTSELNNLSLRQVKQQTSSTPILDKSYVKALYNYFIEMDSNPNCEMPYFITHPSDNFNIDQPIDNQGNTLLHWACSMGDVKMCEILMHRHCNPHVLNNKGEEPIVRSVIYANCYTKRTFNRLLDILSDSLLDVDSNGRTLLHHIALATSDKNNLPSSRYYTEILLRKIAETVHSNETFKEFIDKQDIDGNTALHLMSFNNSKKCIKILLGYNARIDIRNNRNDQVGDYLTDNFKNESNHPGMINGFESIADIGHGMNTNAYDSFNLRPFTPSFNGNHFIRNNSLSAANRITNSYMEPFQLQSLTPAQAQQNALLNFSQSSIIANNNHVSTTSLKMNQLSLEMFDKLNELSNAFDNEVSQKNDDIKELNSIVKHMDDDIEKTTSEIRELLKAIVNTNSNTAQEKEEAAEEEAGAAASVVASEDKNGDNDDDEKSIAASIKKIEAQANELTGDCEEKKNVLRRLIDRSQAMELAKVVQQYEHESLLDIDKSEPSSLESKVSDKTLHQLVDLAVLQIIRKKSVSVLVNIQARSEVNTETINSYRRLVSKLSNMPIDEVDASLNSIEECLRRDIERGEEIPEK